MAAFSGLDNFTEDDPAVVLDGDAVVLGVFNYEGATLALKAAGGAAADHVFDGIGTLSLSDGQVLLTETQAGEAISIPVGSFTQSMVNSSSPSTPRPRRHGSIPCCSS